MNNQCEVLNYDDVVCVAPETFESLDISRTCRVVHLLEAIQEYFNFDSNVAALFSEGVTCEVLKLGAEAWQKGIIRIVLEFCPNQPSESPPPSEEVRPEP